MNPSCPKHLKIINLNKKWHKLSFSNFFKELPVYNISISKTIEIIKRRILTPPDLLTNSTVSRKLTYSGSYCQILDIFQEKCTRPYFFLCQMWTYSKSLLTGIRANSTFRRVFDFKKLQITYCCYIYFSFLLQASAFLKEALPNRNEFYFAYLHHFFQHFLCFPRRA